MKISLQKQLFYLILAILCLVSIIGAVIYYFYALDWFGISITLLLSGIGILYFAKLIIKPREKKTEVINTSDIAKRFITTKTKIKIKPILIGVGYFLPYALLSFGCYVLAVSGRTDAAITSPWQAVSPNFFIAYLAATTYLVFLILKNSKLPLYLIIAHYFLSFSVLWIVFKIGYGYDPFIHQATVDLIDKQGAVDPKPLYYLGQYSLVLIAHKLFFAPIVWLDKLLVPALTALSLPPTIYLFIKKYFKNSSSSIHHLALLFLLILPFSIFTITVPQNLAYLLLILTIFFALLAETKAERVISFLLALAALAVHPIAGLPAMLLAITIFIYRKPSNRICFNVRRDSEAESPDKKIEKICVEKPSEDVLVLKSSTKHKTGQSFNKKIQNIFDFLLGKKFFYAIIFIVNSVALPILFWLTQKNYSSGTSGEEVSTSSGFSLPRIIFPRRENIFLDFIYFFQANEWLILILLAVAAVYVLYHYGKKSSELLILGGFSMSLLIAYFLTSRINFNFLISYERGNFADRILAEAFIFLLPLITIFIYKFLTRILASKPVIKYSWLVLLILLVAVSLYGSYPRRDNFFNSHSFAVGKTDLEAVNWIEKDANGEPYVVLANQQVSVAALWTFGFSRYFKNGGAEIYFYPIPTGGPLYQVYLDMVYKKSDRDTALRAIDLTSAQTVYFVINNYWSGFDKIIEQAKIRASSYESLNNNGVYVFKYTK
jgi:hypothetical protein